MNLGDFQVEFSRLLSSQSLGLLQYVCLKRFL